MKIGITERGDAALNYKEALDRADKLSVNGIVLITKDPTKLLDQIIEKPPKIPYIVHCTITGFGGTELEPNVPHFSKSLVAYRRFISRIGPQRTVLRVDPIILQDLSKETLALVLINCSLGRTRISFLDSYSHIKSRLVKRKIKDLVLFPTLHYPVLLRRNFLNKLDGKPVEVCGEPNLVSIGCVSTTDINALGLDSTITTSTSRQRADCNCLAVKTELLNNKHPCHHNCSYCYWKD